MNITYPAGKRAYIVKTPARKKSIKQLARRSYKAFCGTITSQSITSRKVVMEISRNIKMEMKKMSSNACDSLLNDTFEAVKHFHWNTVWLECEKELPTLMLLLKNIIPKTTTQVTLIGIILHFIKVLLCVGALNLSHRITAA